MSDSTRRGGVRRRDFWRAVQDFRLQAVSRHRYSRPALERLRPRSRPTTYHLSTPSEVDPRATFRDPVFHLNSGVTGVIYLRLRLLVNVI